MRVIILFSLLLGLPTIAAFGQYQNTIFVPPYNPGLQLLNDSIRVPNNDDEDASDTANSRGHSDAEQAVDLTHTSSPSRTKINLRNFVNKTRAQDPVGAAQMEQLFGSVDVIGEIGKVMGQFGLSKDNAADAYAVYWVSAWQASVGDMSTTPAATYKLVAAQAALGLSQSPEFAKANDAQKQEMAEALLVQAALIDAHKESAAGNPEQLKAVANAVRQGAKASGLDLDEMTLTEEGFAPAKGGK